jgi:hypothetical protein
MLGDVAGALGWRPPVRSNAAREIARGAVGDPGPWMLVTGIRPRSLAQALAAEVAPVQEKWFARLYLLKAVIFSVLAIFWIATGIISSSGRPLSSISHTLTEAPAWILYRFPLSLPMTSK